MSHLALHARGTVGCACLLMICLQCVEWGALEIIVIYPGAAVLWFCMTALRGARALSAAGDRESTGDDP
jgi:hypothetical protein